MNWKTFAVALCACLLTICANAQCCTHTVAMQDTYGDGWNGAELEVLINNVSIGIFSAEDFGSSETFDVCPDDTIELIYSPGDYENENSYYLLNAGGYPVFSDGPKPFVGSAYNDIVSCEFESVPGETPCTAIELDLNGCITENNSFLLTSGYEPWCSDYQGEDIWFTIEVPESGNVSFVTNDIGGMNDTGISVWIGEDCFGLNQITCDDDSGEGYLSFLTVFNQNPGDILFIQLWGYGGATGDFELCNEDLGVVELETSELPIVEIDTYDVEIPDEPKIDGFMRVMYNGPGQLTAVTDSANHYYGYIGIETRGQSSQGYPQKPYGLETRDELGENNNVEMLGMPAENDWVLLSNYNDKSFVRNTLAQQLFREMGHYSPRQTLCEVILNGDYQGIYVIGEKLKRDDNRVNIATLNPDESTGDDVTGGYIFKSDLAWGDNSWTSDYSPIDHPDLDVSFVYHYPSEDNITDPQKEYLAEWLSTAEAAMYSDDFADEATGFRAYFDELSFIDYFLVNELSRNNDGFKKSRYYHKDKDSNDGKLHAGPTWDFDWAWKDLASCEIFENTDGSGWAHHINDCWSDNNSPGWYIRMLQDTGFANNLRCRYEYLRYETGILDTAYLFNYIDSVATLVANAQERHYQKWPFLGLVVGAPEIHPAPETYLGEVEALKDWISLRVAWLDENIPGTCYGIPENLNEYQQVTITVYPNPTNDQFTLAGLPHNAAIRILSADGSLLHEEQRVSTSHWFWTPPSNGIYLYQVIDSNGTMQSGKLVKQ